MRDDFEIKEMKRRMEGDVKELKKEIGGMRKGRDQERLMEKIKIEEYGQKMKINKVENIRVKEQRMM